MATLRQHLAGIDAALATKTSAPSNEGTFAPTLIDLSGGQKDYNSYTQPGVLAFALDPAKTPIVGGSVQVNIRGGGFAITYPSTFVGLEGLASGTILAAGVDYPFIFRLGKDWAEVSPGVFQDRVLVIMGKSLTSTHQVVTALAAQAGYSIPRTSALILVQLTQDMNAAGTFTLPVSPALGDIVHVVRHGGGLGLWTRVGGDSSDVLRARDDEIEYQWNGVAWVRLLTPTQQVLRVNAPTYTISGGDHLVDLVFHGQPCVVTVPNNLGTRTRFRLVQEGTATVTLVPASGVSLMPTIGAPLVTAGDGTALAVTVVGNSTGTSALCRIFLESPTADSSPKAGIPFTVTETAAATMGSLPLHGQRRVWRGTSAGAHIVPVSGLTAGTEYEVVHDESVATANCFVEVVSGDGNRRRGGPIGGRLLRPGGRVTIAIDEPASRPRIEGDLDPVPLAAQNGGASFLLVRGLGQPAGSIMTSWSDQYGLNHFSTVIGSPGIGPNGEMTFAQALSDDAYLTRDVTFAGMKLLFGFAMRIDALAGTNVTPILIGNNFAEGRGFYIADAGGGIMRVVVMRAPSSTAPLDFSYTLGRTFAGGVAIDRTTGLVHGFFDEGYVDRERHEFADASANLPWPDWTTRPALIGPQLSSTQSFSGAIFAVEVRDNVVFASQDDQRRQAAAMLTRMRSYAI